MTRNIIRLAIVALWVQPALGDVFDHRYQQKTLEAAIKASTTLAYERWGADLNIDAADTRTDPLAEDSISPGLKQFDLKKTLSGQIDAPDFSTSEFDALLNRIGGSHLMTMQYTAPAQMDLLKFYITNANLRLILRYMQYLDLEGQLKDPVTILRKQAEMDCLRRQSGTLNIDEAFKNCVNRTGAIDPQVFKKLNDPADGRAYLSGKTDVVEVSMRRTKNTQDVWDNVKMILPKYAVQTQQMTYSVPEQNIRQYFAFQRGQAMGMLEKSVQRYLNNQEIMPGTSPFSERHIRQLTLLNPGERYIAISKLATAHSYGLVYQVYRQAATWLKRTINHPQIEAGIKVYLKLALEEIDRDWQMFDAEYGVNNARHESIKQLLEQLDERRQELIKKEQSIHEYAE